MKIRRILNPVAQENTYILENDTACLVIDPGSDTSSILAELKASDKPVAAILLTHTHYDHIMSVEAVRQAYNCLPGVAPCPHRPGPLGPEAVAGRTIKRRQAMPAAFFLPRPS